MNLRRGTGWRGVVRLDYLLGSIGFSTAVWVSWGGRPLLLLIVSGLGSREYGYGARGGLQVGLVLREWSWCGRVRPLE